MDLAALLLPVPPEAKLEDPDYYVWGGSMVQDAQGTYHLFYSRWPRELGFNAWVTHSEVARAVADQPTGPYRHVDVVLPARGKQKWDGLCTHNPTIHKFEDNYYLYYMGNTGDGKNTEGYNWSHRNNQRIGVAVADAPGGPWKRFDEPLIDVSPDKEAPDALLTANPSICRRADGTYLMVYKCVGRKKSLPFGGPVAHRVATSPSPLGPFTKHPDTVFEAAGDSFPAEDPYIWRQEGKLWAITKDVRGSFTGKAFSMALFHSEDGLDWDLAETPLVTLPQVTWEASGTHSVKRLERPQLWLDQGVPAVLFCAVKDGGATYNIHIPLARAASR